LAFQSLFFIGLEMNEMSDGIEMKWICGNRIRWNCRLLGFELLGLWSLVNIWMFLEFHGG
jgi:hypothetical protein